jgi:hypothetical protein
LIALSSLLLILIYKMAFLIPDPFVAKILSDN